MLQLLTTATATNGPPSGAAAGHALMGRQPGKGFANVWYGQPSGIIEVGSSAGGGTMTVTLRLWGYSDKLAKWLPLGSDTTTMSLRGVLNLKSAIGEDGSDIIVHAEPVEGLGGFTRIYLEVVAIGGTSTAINAYLMEDGGY